MGRLSAARRGVFVTGTGAGKSVVAAAISAALRARGERVAAFKPVVTGLDEAPQDGWPHDHELLTAAAGSPGAVAPYLFGPPASPRLAVELAGSRVEPPRLADATRAATEGADALVCEEVGGLLVPLTPGYLVRGLALELGLPVVVAARPGLGTINCAGRGRRRAADRRLYRHPPQLLPVSDESRELDANRHPTIQKLHERRERHQDRHKLVRAGVVVLGALITLAGIVMTGPVPGPGFLVIPVGLALLALEFNWAERLLEKAVVWADNAKEQAANRSKGEKIASGVAVAVGIAAFVTAAILWDIPVLPV